MEKFISQDVCTGGRLKHFGCVFWTIWGIGKKAISNSKSVHFTFNRFFRVWQRGYHKHTYDPDAVARFNLHSREYMWITWCIVYCADTANALPTVSYTCSYRLQRLCTCFQFWSIHNLYTIQVRVCSITCAELWLFQHIHLVVHYFCTSVQPYLMYTMQFQCFGLSVLPYLVLLLNFVRTSWDKKLQCVKSIQFVASGKYENIWM